MNILSLGKGLKKRGIFHEAPYPPPRVSGKEKKYLCTMKPILYDMGLLTLVRWLLQRAFKFEPPFGSGSELKRVPPPKN